MPELLCHLVGDYVLQNHRMALRKTSSWTWASIHVAFYMLPFLVIARNPVALTIMATTHLVIDRFSLAKMWPAFWGVGCEGKVLAWFRLRRGELNPPEPAPPFLAVWLAIIVDNTAHFVINHWSLAHFP